MKKVIFAGVLSCLMFASGVIAAPAISLIVNGNSVNADVKIIKGSSYVPLRAVSEILGAEVKWDGNTKTITINTGSTAEQPVHKASQIEFIQTTAEKTDFGWDVVTEVKNNSGKNYGGITFTATFYDRDGKRIGTASGAVLDLKNGETKTARLLTMDDLTEYSTIKYQIDASY